MRENERFVVYRLGRIVKPAYKPGYCILFPFVDTYQRLTTSLKEFVLPNLQVLNCENTIVETTVQVRYQINDPIKMANSVQDLTFSLKSMTRIGLVSLLSKKDASKIENERNYIQQELKENMNADLRKWGVEIVSIEM